MHGFDTIHALQRERGLTGLRLSIGVEVSLDLSNAQRDTDETISLRPWDMTRQSRTRDRCCLDDDLPRLCSWTHGSQLLQPPTHLLRAFDETVALASELRQIPNWLHKYSSVLPKHPSSYCHPRCK